MLSPSDRPIREERRSSLQHRMFFALAITCSIVAVLVLAASAEQYQRAVVLEAKAGLGQECAALASVLGELPPEPEAEASFLKDLDFGEVRVTIVAPDGKVLFDSRVDATQMGNHRDRPEVRGALESGEGTSTRESLTMGSVTVYQARKLKSGAVLRLGVDRRGVSRIIFEDLETLAATLVIIFVAVWFVSRTLSRWLVRPILDIDLEGGQAVSPYCELEPMVDRMNEQYVSVLGRMEQIRDADDMRREFTANVTHELKTPIASISAAAELIRDGLVLPDDVSDFGGRIYGDAQRLSALVGDILTLSKLDEWERAGDEALLGAVEKVDLFGVATDVGSRLEPRADRLGVGLLVVGSPTPIWGNAQLLDVMVGNLVSNAIRYNRVGGGVRVTVFVRDGRPTLCVKDTGVGIPTEEQAKVFERFYRIEKGRSRDTGGTGLGLAIVKHAAVFHGADVSLVSKVGEGTTITVTFPATASARQGLPGETPAAR